MSLVYITYHDESIFDVDKMTHRETVERFKYTSKFRNDARKLNLGEMNVIDTNDGYKLLTNSAKSRHKTMGFAETPLKDPANFLRKNQGIRWRRQKTHHCEPTSAAPAVPRFPHPKPKPIFASEPIVPTAASIKPPTTCKNEKHRANFIVINIKKVKSAVPKPSVPRYVDMARGDTHNKINSGLMPQYICHKNFGKVPCYLKSHKRMISKWSEHCKRAQVERDQPKEMFECKPYLDAGMKLMSLSERMELLNGLRTNLGELNLTYQRLPLHTDTVAKKIRKSKMEAELRQLEQDIYLLENNPTIFITQF